MTRCVEVPDAMPGKENPAARGGEATRLFLNYRDGSSLQQQGLSGSIIWLLLARAEVGAAPENCGAQKTEKLNLYS